MPENVSVEAKNYKRHPMSFKCEQYNGWSVINGDFKEYLQDFEPINQDGFIDKYLESLKNNKKQVVIDLMATPHALLSYKSEYLSDSSEFKGLAVGFVGDKSYLDNSKKNSDEFGISYINGNLSYKKTWDSIKRWLGDVDKVDLIVSRGAGGVHYVPDYPNYQLAVVNKCWDMLADGGLAILQIRKRTVSKEKDIHFYQWLEKLTDLGINYRFLAHYPPSRGKYVGEVNDCGLFMIQKDIKIDHLPGKI